MITFNEELCGMWGRSGWHLSPTGCQRWLGLSGCLGWCPLPPSLLWAQSKRTTFPHRGGDRSPVQGIQESLCSPARTSKQARRKCVRISHCPYLRWRFCSMLDCSWQPWSVLLIFLWKQILTRANMKKQPVCGHWMELFLSARPTVP